LVDAALLAVVVVLVLVSVLALVVKPGAAVGTALLLLVVPNIAVYSSSYSCDANRAIIGLPLSLTTLNGWCLSSWPSKTKLTLEHSVKHAKKLAVMSVGVPGV
jgi:hypothetical protein